MLKWNIFVEIFLIVLFPFYNMFVLLVTNHIIDLLCLQLFQGVWSRINFQKTNFQIIMWHTYVYMIPCVVFVCFCFVRCE